MTGIPNIILEKPLNCIFLVLLLKWLVDRMALVPHFRTTLSAKLSMSLESMLGQKNWYAAFKICFKCIVDILPVWLISVWKPHSHWTHKNKQTRFSVRGHAWNREYDNKQPTRPTNNHLPKQEKHNLRRSSTLVPRWNNARTQAKVKQQCRANTSKQTWRKCPRLPCPKLVRRHQLEHHSQYFTLCVWRNTPRLITETTQ